MEGRVRAGVALASVMLAAEFSKIKISTLPPPSFLAPWAKLPVLMHYIHGFRRPAADAAPGCQIKNC